MKKSILSKWNQIWLKIMRINKCEKCKFCTTLFTYVKRERDKGEESTKLLFISSFKCALHLKCVIVSDKMLTNGVSLISCNCPYHTVWCQF